jgi:oligopeptide/dipeptide ABC transporter ATP-binding protein
VLQQASVGREVALSIRGLKVVFHTYAGDVQALEGVDLEVRRGEILGLVGESGCGKSVTALAVAGLLPINAEVTAGEVLLDGRNLLEMKKEAVRISRLRDIALVFQDPMTYLNPVLTIGLQITEALTSDLKVFADELIEARMANLQTFGTRSPEAEKELESLRKAKETHQLNKKEGKRLASLRALDYLRLVRLSEPEKVLTMYPFELSGGMRQRAMIAIALVRRPRVLLADEITTALDVTVQAQILELLKDLRDKIDAAIVLITHDLAVVSEVCDRVAVMYAGSVVEVAGLVEFFKNPTHPYSKGLAASVLRPDTTSEHLESIKGSVPDLIYPPSGCRFHPRCPFAFQKCPESKPPMTVVSPGHEVACFLYGG